jgi:hypothetical protein
VRFLDTRCHHAAVPVDGSANVGDVVGADGSVLRTLDGLGVLWSPPGSRVGTGAVDDADLDGTHVRTLGTVQPPSSPRSRFSVSGAPLVSIDTPAISMTRRLCPVGGEIYL